MTQELSDFTWQEVEAELEADTTLVIVMTGSTEQHGPGLPLSVDELRADELGERVADKLGCFLAPTVRPGISDHHMTFPGTISLRQETFENILRDYCRSFNSHGFETIALLTTHGGNAGAIETVATEMDDELDAHVFVPGDRDDYLETRYGVMEDYGIDQEAAGQHGGAAETSFIMRTHPHLVHEDELAVGHMSAVNGERLKSEGLAAVTDNGVLGDQTVATEDAGRAIVTATADYLTEAIRQEIE